MKKLFLLLLTTLIFNGCAVYFAIEFDVCKNCSKSYELYKDRGQDSCKTK